MLHNSRGYISISASGYSLFQPVVIIGWLVSIGLTIAVVFGLYGYMNPEYKPMDQDIAALYEATHRIVWSLGIGWIVFACVTGYGGLFINGYSPNSSPGRIYVVAKDILVHKYDILLIMVFFFSVRSC